MGSARLVYEMSRFALAKADGYVVVIKVPMDESGVHDNSPVLTVAAYLGRPSHWRGWTKRWNVAKRPIKVFHSTDSQNLRGEFKGWNEERRDPLVIRLLDVMEESALPGVVIGLLLRRSETMFPFKRPTCSPMRATNGCASPLPRRAVLGKD